MRKNVALFMAILLIVLSFSGCPNPPPPKDYDTAELKLDGEPNNMPITNTPVTLTYYKGLAKAGATLKSLNEMKAYQELEKKTGVKIEFVTPAQGTEKEKYNIMVAGGNLTDIVSITENYIEDVSQLTDKDIARPLNTIINNYAPNYAKTLEKYELVKKAVTDDNGQIVTFSGVQPLPECWGITGFVTRADWLDILGLEIPETIPQWETMLTAFRDKDPNKNGKKDEIPMGSAKNRTVAALAGTWGVSWSFYMSGGLEEPKIGYGPIQPEFKDYMITLNRWFEEELIDQNYLATDDQLINSKITNNRIGSMKDSLIRAVGTYNDLMLGNKETPDFLLWPTPYPKVDDNSPVNYLNPRLYSLGAVGGAIISTKCAEEKVKIAAKWLDYGFTEEGQKLYNFGVVGEGHTMVDGKPIYTDLILKNKTYVPSDAWARYVPAGPCVQDPGYFEQLTAQTAYQRQALVTWKRGWSEAGTTKVFVDIPPFTLSEAERKKDVSIWTDLDTELQTSVNQFIMGLIPIDTFDDFVARLKSIGADESVSIRQAALERWINKGGKIDPKKPLFDNYDKSNYKRIPIRNMKGVDHLDKDLYDPKLLPN